MRPWGNQHSSLKATLLSSLDIARSYLDEHSVEGARYWLWRYRHLRATVPASTLRRWKCGQ